MAAMVKGWIDLDCISSSWGIVINLLYNRDLLIPIARIPNVGWMTINVINHIMSYV